MNFSRVPGLCLAAAIASSFAIGQALAAPGDLDLSFGAGTGMVRDAVGVAGGQGHAIVIDSGGHIVIAGTARSTPTDSDFGVLRLNADGSLDASFGVNGRSIQDGPSANDDEAYAVTLLADDKLVIAGISLDLTTQTNFSALRVNVNGSIDSAFGNNGNGWMVSARPNSDGALAISAAPGGGFLLGGYVASSSLNDAASLRLDSLGMPDPLYGNNGFVFGADDSNSFRAAAVQTDGKAVFGGQIDNNGGAIVQRFNADGSVDSSFAGDGRTELGAVLTRVTDVHVLADGRILVLGQHLANARILRLNADGSLDAGFGSGGALTVSAASLGLSQLFPESIALDSEFRLLASGSGLAPATGSQLLLLRGLPDGQLDASFASGGVRLLDGAGQLYGDAVAVQPDGAIVVAGSEVDAVSGQGQYLAVRFEGGGGGGPQLPVLSISDASLVEGNSGSSLMSFTVNLSAPSDGTVNVDIGTDLGSATPGGDYTPTTAVASNFPNGTSSIVFQVPVLGDMEDEANETLFVRLSNPVGATLGDAEAIGTIIDDDRGTPPPPTAQVLPGPGPLALAALGLMLLAAALEHGRRSGRLSDQSNGAQERAQH